ncbi:MAG: DEAD/DEAH box helicase [Promethearchaeota archaeon]
MDNKTQQKTFSPLNTDKSPIELILRALGTAAKIFPPINRALQEKHPSEIRLSSNEVIDFLKYPKDLMIQSGFNIILPEMFTTGGKQRLSARLVIRTSEKKSSKKGISSQFDSMFDINSMLEYKWEASLGEQKISEDEFLNLLNSTDPLVNIKGNWVLVEFNDIEALRDASNSGKKTYIEALKLGLTGKIQLQENGPEYEVVVEGEFGEIVQKLKTIDTLKEISCPLGFRGELRPYQEDALSWMGNLSTLNLGLCLADDMGLGKTVQVIAFLLFRKELLNKNAKSILIICPTSVLFNWRREMEKFAPELSITVHHGLDRIKNALDLKKYLKPNEIVLTTYGTARNDVDILQVIPFDGIIIDESQNIKNYSSQQTQAILRLQAKFRIALSGTPVENRLLELWTLFEFLNPGLLGSKTEFQDNYILPIERFQDKDAIDKLKKVISPFILRRVKTDKSIINDLPEKNEIKLFVELSNEQINLYQNAVDTAFKEMKDAENNKKKKKGILLALLVKLKQICNHPYQYSKKSFKKCKDKEMIRDFSSRSKKTKRLVQMIEEVIDNGEKVLVFTQFKEMGSLLQNLLESIFNFKVLFFHGSVPEHKRREIVDKFQSKDIESPPILILSLKAGGTGLNLTQGTTIFHFDRWWNPAVEDQATDRAYRIGQKERVNVYKFITVGTIEEKIDMLLEDKKQLAESVITSSGESWISDLSEDKLKEMLSLTI